MTNRFVEDGTDPLAITFFLRSSTCLSSLSLSHTHRLSLQGVASFKRSRMSGTNIKAGLFLLPSSEDLATTSGTRLGKTLKHFGYKKLVQIFGDFWLL